MPERKTVGQLMEEMRLKAGAQNYHGHEYMDLERFAEDTRHMIIFDVLTDDSPVGWKGERTRLYLTEAGYQKSLENQEKGHIKILSHAKVRQGHLYYVPQDTSYLCGTLSEFAEENNLDESLFKAILRKMDFERVQFEKDIKDFSGGQKKKVLIAKSLCEKAHLYVWDEPLNFIDVYSRMQIEQLITEFAPTMLLVEHDSVFRDTVASKIVNVGAILQSGNI